MESLLTAVDGVMRIAASNAIVVAIAAPLVWGIGRLAHKPALTHALWLVVLLKLVTPPVWTIPVHTFPARSLAARPVIAPPVREIPLAVTRAPQSEPILQGDVGSPPVSSEMTLVPLAHERPATIVSPIVDTPPVAPAAPSALAIPQPPNRVSWKFVCPIAAGVWACGSLFCLGITSLRIARFRKLLGFAVPAPIALQQQARTLARRLGLRSCPAVWLVPGAMCPMLWAGGTRARVLIPRGLWEVLDDAQRDTLLLHELAHLRRRDHWVRWIELAATVLYWWHPACWWARRGLREAEEQCCDAWVLWAQPGAFRSYATALLTTVDYVSVRQSVPALASGMGQFHLLKARLTMLKKGNVSRALTWGGFAAACGTGALLLSIAPTLAQSAPEPAAESQQAPTAQDTATAPAAQEVAPPAEKTAPPTPAADVAPPAQNGTPGAAGQPTPEVIGVAPAPVATTPELTIRAGSADAAPSITTAVPVATTPPPVLPPPTPAAPNARDQQFRAEMQAVQARNMAQYTARNAAQNDEVAVLRQQVEMLTRELKTAQLRLQHLQAGGNLEKPMDANAVPEGPRRFNRNDAGNGNPNKTQFYWNGKEAVTLPTATPEDRERRLDRLEKALSSLLDEVRSMKQGGSPDNAPRSVPTPAGR